MSEPKYMPATADSLARAHTAEAIGALVSVIRDKFAKPGEKVAAANSLLDRGHGKAAQAVISVPARQALVQRMAAMDDSALLAIIAAARAGGVPQEGGPNAPLQLEGPFGMKPDDITDAEWAQANPPPEEPVESADSEEFQTRPKLAGNPWD